MDFVSLAMASVALSQIMNVAHTIDRIEFIIVGGERVRVDYGVPRYWGDADSAYCGFASQAFIFVNTACNDNERILRHEIKHIEQFQWWAYPPWNESRYAYDYYRLGFEVAAIETEEE